MNKLTKNLLTYSLLTTTLIVVALYAFHAYAQQQPISDAIAAQRQRLLDELAGVEREIAQTQALADEKAKEAGSLQRDIAILDANIKKAQLQIRAINLTIETYKDRIFQKEETIEQLTARITREKISLSEALRSLNEYDDLSTLEVMLSYDKISDFLGEVDSINTVQESLQDSFNTLKVDQKEEETAKEDLVDRKTEQERLHALSELERKKLQTAENQKQALLKATKGKESEYKKVVTQKQKDAASIRTALFQLQGSSAISFEKAVLYAERASIKTGVRTAFVLGVISQESDLGRNVGQCNLPDDPPKFRWQAIMKPARDHAPYLDITKRLGLDPEKMPLSCPMSVGWGGAMGPAQFIPSTWILYEGKIAAATGHNPPNPWDPEDAFMASAIYMKELGATTREGEFIAAAKYFAGGNWNSSLGRTYGSQVVAKADNFQEQINIIQGLASR